MGRTLPKHSTPGQEHGQGPSDQHSLQVIVKDAGKGIGPSQSGAAVGGLEESAERGAAERVEYKMDLLAVSHCATT